MELGSWRTPRLPTSRFDLFLATLRALSAALLLLHTSTPSPNRRLHDVYVLPHHSDALRDWAASQVRKRPESAWSTKEDGHSLSPRQPVCRRPDNESERVGGSLRSRQADDKARGSSRKSARSRLLRRVESCGSFEEGLKAWTAEEHLCFMNAE